MSFLQKQFGSPVKPPMVNGHTGMTAGVGHDASYWAHERYERMLIDPMVAAAWLKRNHPNNRVMSDVHMSKIAGPPALRSLTDAVT